MTRKPMHLKKPKVRKEPLKMAEHFASAAKKLAIARKMPLKGAPKPRYSKGHSSKNPF